MEYKSTFKDAHLCEAGWECNGNAHAWTKASLKQTHREVILRHMLIKCAPQPSLNSHWGPCVYGKQGGSRGQTGGRNYMVWKQAGTEPWSQGSKFASLLQKNVQMANECDQFWFLKPWILLFLQGNLQLTYLKECLGLCGCSVFDRPAVYSL